MDARDNGEDDGALPSAPAAVPPRAAKPEHYDTQFIVNRLQADRRTGRLKVLAVAALLAGVVAGVVALTARRAEAPGHVVSPGGQAQPPRPPQP